MGHKKHRRHDQDQQSPTDASQREESDAIVRSDKYWRKTGNIFVETAVGDQPSGLAATTGDYTLHLLDDDGKSMAEFTFDAPKLSNLLARLEASGEVRTLTINGHSKREGTSGYLVPLSLIPDIMQMMAGVDIRAERKHSENRTPITITTDGSFRPGGKGGGHVILERLGSAHHRDDFRITLTWQANIRDSYESEVRGVLEALKYLEQGRKSCNLLIRCDNMGVVNVLNEMNTQLRRTGFILPVARTKPCSDLWQDIAEHIQIHSFTAEYAKYDAADPDTKECHHHANDASRQWQDRGHLPHRRRGRG